MTKAILVGYDPATRDRAPVDFGVAAARFTGAPLVLASVHRRRREEDPLGQLHEELLDDVGETLEQVRADMSAQGIAIESRELAGTSAPRALHEAAEAEDAGLLVVGSTQRGPAGRVLPGSTAQRLMHGAPCPIAVVPCDWRAGGGLATMGVAYVDSDEGREALRGGYALAQRAGATLRVLTVATGRARMYSETEAQLAGRRGKDFDEVEGEHRVFAESAARAAVAQLGADDGATIEVDAFLGDPADTLVRVSEDIDLLVCGSRGYGPLRAVLLGGISRRVTAEAKCPVIVLPRGVEASLESLLA